MPTLVNGDPCSPWSHCWPAAGPGGLSRWRCPLGIEDISMGLADTSPSSSWEPGVLLKNTVHVFV